MPTNGIEAAKPRAKIDLHVAAYGPAQVLEPLDECCVSFLSIPFDSAAREHNNTPCPLALLRAGNERPRHSSAETRNEFPSPHVRPRVPGGHRSHFEGCYGRAETNPATLRDVAVGSKSVIRPYPRDVRIAPSKRTSARHGRWSQKCHVRSHVPQQR